MVDSQEKAIDAVRWYGARGYWQIKIYNSMNPAWVPAMVEEAHLLGMRVAGHVPAFSTADDMIEAGYDEMTHINQFMLGWVIEAGRGHAHAVPPDRAEAPAGARPEQRARCSTPSS